MLTKIFVSYHKKAPLLLGANYIPLNVGRALKNIPHKDLENVSYKDIEWLRNNTLGDDTGDNISNKNRSFCEMTGIYWVWKNLYQFPDLTHIGHMQYRRHFYFNRNQYEKVETNLEKACYSCVHFNSLNKKYIQSLGLDNAEGIDKLLSSYEGIIPLEGDLSFLGIENLWQDYVERIPGIHIDDLSLLADVLSTKSACFGNSFEDYLNQPKKLMYQMFVLKKEEFLKYCEFIFPLLFEIEKKVDSRRYSINGKRTIGYLAELLYGWYFLFLRKEQNFFKTGVSYIEGI